MFITVCLITSENVIVRCFPHGIIHRRNSLLDLLSIASLMAGLSICFSFLWLFSYSWFVLFRGLVCHFVCLTSSWGPGLNIVQFGFPWIVIVVEIVQNRSISCAIFHSFTVNFTAVTKCVCAELLTTTSHAH